MNARLIFSHPTGNANVKGALAGLLASGVLEEFHTTVATYPGNVWDKLSRTKFGRDLQRRKYDERLQSLTRQHPFRELGRLVAGRFKLESLNRHETGFFCTDAVYRALDEAVAHRIRQNPGAFSGVYAYEDGASETFRAARDHGLRRIYDLPIAYWQTARRLLHEEAQRLPAWEPTLGATRDSEAKLRRKTSEMELAEVVMCPSQFVADSLPAEARANKKVVVAFFGSPTSSQTEVRKPSAGNKLRVLFAGSMSQRKGLGDLFAAARMLQRNDIEFVIMGGPLAPMEFYRKEFDDFTYEAGRPHAEVLELMRSCDVFCLPSIVEGRALVMQEAMSQGLPLIITPNTGGEDLVEEGVTGFMVPIRRADLIAEKINWFANHRSELAEMSRAARNKASQLTWDLYGQAVARAVIGSVQS